MNYAEQLYQKIWKTKGSRFIAHKRLENLNQLSNYSIAVNSIYVIVLSVLSLEQFQDMSKLDSNSLSILTLFLSVLIIVISVIESSKSYKAKAESQHQCGKELNKIYERLIQIKNNYNTDNNVIEEVNELGIEYQNIIDKYPENHLTLDFKRFLLENNETKDKKGFALFWLWLQTYILVLLSMMLPLLFILFFVIKLS